MDSVSRKILDKLISSGKGTNYICSFSGSSIGPSSTNIVEFSESLNMDVEDLRAAVRYLEDAGYLEYQMMTTAKRGRIPAGFHLSHKGLNWRYFWRKEILDYIADKWVDFIAAAISFVSLIISIVAILQGP